MLKRALAVVAITLAVGCSEVLTTYVPDVYFDYSGEWTLKWVNSDSHHPVSLAQKGHDLSGIYTNAEDIACSISGKHTLDLKVTLALDCPEWDISMDGISTQKGTVISGHYEAPSNSGKFILFKNVPAPAVAENKGKKSS
jgi:hypothetical protein